MKSFFQKIIPGLLWLCAYVPSYGQPLTINSFAPASAPVGSSVTIFCSEFNGYIVDVFFNGVPSLTVNGDDPTTITAMVPDGATTGKIQVEFGGSEHGTATSLNAFIVGPCIPGSLGSGCGGPELNVSYFNSVSIRHTTDGTQMLSTNTGCSGGYSDFTTDNGKVANLRIGQNYFAELTMHVPTSLQGFGGWIDWNKDNDFNDAGEFVLSGYEAVSSTTSSLPFSIPSTAAPGYYRMRLRSSVYKWGTANQFLPNESCLGLIGETEDYTIMVDSYCLPSYTQSCTNVSGLFINAISFGSSTFGNTGCGGYKDNFQLDLPTPTNPNRKANVTAGTTYALNVKLGTAGFAGVWIDYNNDKTFAATEFVGSNSVAGTNLNLFITIPTTGNVLGLRRMRVRCFNTALTSGQPCTKLTGAGETEDIMVDIALNGGVMASGNQTICNGAFPAAIAFSSAPLGGSSFLYTWYSKAGLQAQPTGAPDATWTSVASGLGASFATHNPAAITSTRTYACFVTPGLGGTGAWANGVRQVTVLPAFNAGTITSGDQSFCTSGNPANITMSVNPTGSGAYQWRWYYKENVTGTCPTGNSIAGWITNSTSANITGTTTTGAGISFDPVSAGSLGAGRTFAVLITPIANGSIPACGAAQFANSCRKTSVVNCSTFNPGIIQGIWFRVCYNYGTGSIAFDTPPSGAATYGYQWYSYNAVVSPPTGSTIPAGWNPVPGQTGAIMTSQAGLTSNKTYACFVTPNVGNGAWAAGYRQYQVMPQPNTGTLTPANQTLSSPASPAVITFSTPPAGADGYYYQWFEKAGIVAAPTGSALDPSWTAVSTPTFVTSSFTPPAGQTISKSFACYVNSTGIGGIGCIVMGWASGVRQITVNQLFIPGSISAGNQTICNGALPALMSCTGSTAGSTYHWHYKNGVQPAPANTDPVGTWIQESVSSSGNSYTPATGINTSRTYACRVTNGANSQWATGVRQVTVLPAFTAGAVAMGDQTLCANGNPAPITLSNPPVGSGNYSYQWYYKAGILSCPTGSSANGWLLVSNGTGPSYDPQSAGPTGRTFALLVTPTGTPACGAPAFAVGCRKVTVETQPCNNSRMAINDEAEMREATEPKLEQNLPNPFSNETTIPCFIPEDTKNASLEIFCLDGRKVEQILLTGTGNQVVRVESKMLPAIGLYFYTLVIDGQKQPMQRMVLVK